MSDSENEEVPQGEENPNLVLSDPAVVNKYRTAAEIANRVLKAVIDASSPGKRVVELCMLGDELIEEETGKLYNKGKGKVEKNLKGIGFPTCVSVNNIVGHFSPREDDESELKAGDLVKVDLGVNIDGCHSQVAHSFVCGGVSDNPRVNDVIKAAYTASECAIRLLKPGNKGEDITKMFSTVGDEFDVKPMLSMLSSNVTRNGEGDKSIFMRTDAEMKVPDVEIEPNEVYAIDIIMSTGAAKPITVPEKTTVYQRRPDVTYALKMKASRATFSEIKKKFPYYAFTARSLEGKSRFGLIECCKHELLEEMHVLQDKEGEFVAQFKFTALITASGATKITGLPLDIAQYPSDHNVENEEIKKVLALRAGGKKKKKKKKKAASDE